MDLSLGILPDLGPLQAPVETVEKKKRGRPPLNTQNNKSILRLSGAKSQKKFFYQIQLSPKRKA